MTTEIDGSSIEPPIARFVRQVEATDRRVMAIGAGGVLVALGLWIIGARRRRRPADERPAPRRPDEALSAEPPGPAPG